MAVTIGRSPAIEAVAPTFLSTSAGMDERIAMADQALNWLTANLDRFEPFQGQPKPDRRKHKALVELTLLSMCLRRQTIFAADARVARFLDVIVQAHRNPVFREIVFRESGDFAGDAFVPVALRACGLLADDDAEWQALQNLIEHSSVLCTSRAPHRMLELVHLLDLGGFRYHLPHSPIVYRNSVLNQPVDLIRITNHEAYILTHTLFYVADFGFKRDVHLPQAQRRRVTRLVEHLLGLYVREAHWDLVGELLLCCHSLRHTDSPLYALGWQAFLTAQWPDGTVPGPNYDPREAAGLDEEPRREYVFRHCYHTTLVAALAGAVCQENGDDDGADA